LLTSSDSVTFTADTGAARTVVSAKNVHKIPLSQRPTLQKYNILASANGQPLTELGKGVFTIKLGKLTLDSEVIIAEIEDDALFGLDILMKGEGGPADIGLTEGIILLNKTKIPCTI
jgi:predicted aspartyl protease